MAAIIHTDGIRNVDPRRVAIFGRTDPRPQEVPVLSPLYEPLQYSTKTVGGIVPSRSCNGTVPSFCPSPVSRFSVGWPGNTPSTCFRGRIHDMDEFCVDKESIHY